MMSSLAGIYEIYATEINKQFDCQPEQKKLKILREKAAKTSLQHGESKNSELVDSYIENVLDDYIKANAINLGISNKSSSAGLSDLLDITVFCEQEFLSKKTWCDVLGGRNTSAVAENFMCQSEHFDRYHKIKLAEDARKGKLKM